MPNIFALQAFNLPECLRTFVDYTVIQTVPILPEPALVSITEVYYSYCTHIIMHDAIRQIPIVSTVHFAN